MCSTLLDPPPKLSDLKMESENLRQELKHASGATRECLFQALDAVKEKIVDEVKCDVQSSLGSLSTDMGTLDKDLHMMKSLNTKIYELVVDLTYKDGIDLIDSTYQFFLKGLNNFNKTHSHLASFIAELESKAGLSFKARNIAMYLKKVTKTRGRMEAQHLVSYILVVRAKFLQIVTAFYLYDNDMERVELEFRSFNRDVKKLQKIHEELFEESFHPQVPSAAYSPVLE